MDNGCGFSKFNDRYSAFSYWKEVFNLPVPICVLCGENLSSEAVIQGKLKHLTTTPPESPPPGESPSLTRNKICLSDNRVQLVLHTLFSDFKF